ncbi:hypothetical protein [uncultured Odoribacter sp.]|uniref:hypothetical protein n=1 Tax=uncultured Odoribacter sp. TaxID=876416 RepID=UPI0026168704|nr:hypothetical protein [uncultured Odoribacter sp.]
MDNFDDKYRKKNPFSVPEGYFEHLTNQVLEKIKEEEKPQKVSFVQLLKPYMGLAAIFLLAFVIVQFVVPHFIDNNKMLKKVNTEMVTSVEENTSDNFVLDGSFNPTSEEILEYLSTEVSDYDLIYAELY